MQGGANDAQAGEAGAGTRATVLPFLPIDESNLPEPTLDVGFIDLDPTSYSAEIEQYLYPSLPAICRGGAARMFYRFVPADSDAKQKPLFVVFNGGPGFTSMLLLSFGTGPMTLDADAPTAPAKTNPYSLTQLGNLLYIDARNAGFSYLLSQNPDDADELSRSVSIESFNPELDAADFIRVVLRVLERQPAVRNNPVVILGESYGGTRAAIMLYYLLYPATLSSANDLYVDTALQTELLDHYHKVFGDQADARTRAETYAQQFGWQLLIEPLVAGSRQYDEQRKLSAAAEQRMATAADLTTDQLEDTRCIDNRAKTNEWCDSVGTQLATVVPSPAGFTALMGTSPLSVPHLQAAQRGNAYRALSPVTDAADPADWTTLLGSLGTLDRYFLSLRPSRGSGVWSQTDIYGYTFLHTARHVHTLITNARWDDNILSEAIVPTLNDLSTEFPDIGFTGASYDDGDPAETFTLSYGDTKQWHAANITVRFPTFENSGHMVTVSEPARFFEVTRAFLQATGLE